MTRCLVTGLGGFLGSYLGELLVQEGQDVTGTVYSSRKNVAHLTDHLEIVPCVVEDRLQLERVVEQSKPEIVFHLAAQSLPSRSWQDPEGTFRSNVLGTLNLFEAIRNSGISPRILIVCSSSEYGFSTPNEIPIKETKALHPVTPYGVSKAAADMLSEVYGRTLGMDVVRARPFFAVGPRKIGDVCSDFARGIVAVERGLQESVSVGNLEAVRDFLDARDAAQGLLLLARQGVAGDVYNLCSGHGHKIQEILDIMVSLATIPIPILQDPARMRPADEPEVVGDNSKIRALGWVEEFNFEGTLRDILEYWRRQP